MTHQRSVLVTGGAGFIGSHLVGSLLQRGDRVTVIDDLSTGRLENISPYVDHPSFRFAIDSITNEIVLDRLASEADVIVHLAAAVGVQLIVDRPVHTIETNIGGTELVMRAALRYRARVLLASTSEVYGKSERLPFAEEDDLVLGPTTKSRWGYAASKMVDEFLALAYHREHDLDVVVFRLFNTVGPGQTGRYGMVVPRFVDQAVRGDALTVFGDGEQRRCFCDVRDVVRAIVDLAETDDGAIGEVFNIGGTDETTIRGLAERVIAICDSESSIRLVPYDEAYGAGFEDMRRRVPDTRKIHDTIGWQPAIPLADTIAAVRDRLVVAPRS